MPSEPQVNVLLVDDHPENLIALEAILEGLGQNLVKAHSGTEALRCLLEQDFAVILLDVQMPEIDGFETATLIRQRERSRHTPIIFLTAFSTSDSLMFKGYALGAVDYLLKPIDSTVLTSKVAVFVDLYKKTAEVQRQAAQLAAINTELGQSEERFRSLSACSPMGIFLTDIRGNCTYLNPICEAMFSCKLGENLETEWLRAVFSEDQSRVLADWSSCIRRGLDYSDEFRIVDPDGTIRWVHLRASPMRSDYGHPLGYVGTIEDITERKQAEATRNEIIREQAARQQAESANRMKDEFLAILSHELRTPLNSMLGWARLLLSRKFDEATTIRALETIERNAKSQAQLIEDILDVSLIIRGKLRLRTCPVNLVPLIESVLETLQPSASAKSIELKANLESTTDLVAGDPERLRQVIWNLLSNAIKFTPNEGQVEVQLERQNAYVRLQVIDTGIGISSEFLPHVFDRFRQADSTTTRSYGGLGLGLAIVHHLVELHGGKIDAESKGEGQGATFTLTLPLFTNPSQTLLEVEPPPNQPMSSVPPPSLVGLQILMVEDNADTREFVATVLRQSGAKVTAVESVREAMEQFEKTRPDVLVSDIGMPGEDGYDLIRQVRDLENQQEEKIPAIALTAYAKLEERMRVLAAGFQVHVPKPVEPGALVAVVAKLAGRADKE